jgi:hypothetical protein
MQLTYLKRVVFTTIIFGVAYAHAPFVEADEQDKTAKHNPLIPIGCLLRDTCDAHSKFRFESHASDELVAIKEFVARDPREIDYLDADAPNIRIDIVEKSQDADKLFSDTLKGVKEWQALPADQKYPNKPSGPSEIHQTPERIKLLQDYADSEKGGRCTAAIAALEAAVHSSDFTKTEKLSVVANIYIDYVKECYDSDSEIEKEVLDRLALFIGPSYNDMNNQVIFCTGFNFFKNYIVTAKHCVYDPRELDQVLSKENATAAHFQMHPLNLSFPSREKVVLLGDLTTIYSAQVYRGSEFETSSTYNPYDMGNDVAVIELTGRTDSTPAFPVAKPIQFAQLVYPAAFYDANALLRYGLGKANPSPELQSYVSQLIRVDTSPICSVAIVKGSCIVHACQTREGLSGTPIIQRQNGSLALVGVHDGAMVNSNPACKFGRSRYFPNYGSVLPWAR